MTTAAQAPLVAAILDTERRTGTPYPLTGGAAISRSIALLDRVARGRGTTTTLGRRVYIIEEETHTKV